MWQQWGYTAQKLASTANQSTSPVELVVNYPQHAISLLSRSDGSDLRSSKILGYLSRVWGPTDLLIFPPALLAVSYTPLPDQNTGHRLLNVFQAQGSKKMQP